MRAMSWLVLCVALLPSLAAADEPPTTPLLRAIEAAANPAPEPSHAVRLGTPKPMPMQPSSCPAWLECPAYNCTISCNGSYCVSEMGDIICDNTYTYCPGNGCYPPPGCEDPCGYCECTSQGGTLCRRTFCFPSS